MSMREPIDVSDHELLARLARDDPARFERLRNELIAGFIDRAPEDCRRSLRGLQFRVDCIRRLAHTPLATLIKIQALMWESFLKMEQELHGLVHCVQGNAVSSEAAQRPESDSSRGGRVIELEGYLLNRHRYGLR
ncbi:MAG: DUF3135 domain-containing protein [Propionivibrio sp.]